VRAAGGTLTLDDLRRFRPKWRKGTAIRFRDQTIVFAPPPAGVGVGGSLMWRMLADGERYRDATEGEKLHLFVEAAKRAFAARPGWLRRGDPAATARTLADPQWAAALMKGYRADSASAAATLNPPPVPVAENPAGAGFVVVDLVGQAVACTLTNYNLFGTGRVAPGTGIVLAAAPAPGTDRNALSLGPVLSFETETRRFRFAAAGAGGAAALTATMMVAGETLLRQTTVEKGINAPRVHDTGAPDVVLAERSLPAKQVAALRARGHRVRTVPTLGRVNAAECPLGLDSSSEDIACFVFTDPRAAGMAAEAER